MVEATGDKHKGQTESVNQIIQWIDSVAQIFKEKNFNAYDRKYGPKNMRIGIKRLSDFFHYIRSSCCIKTE